MGAITLARVYCCISDEEIKIIEKVQKPMLYHNDELWIKRNSNNFDVAMGAQNSAQTSELVGVYLLWRLQYQFNLLDVELYCDDGLMILRKKSPKEVEDTNQRIKRFFKDPGLRAKIEVSITVDNFLDESMNLDTRLYRP